MIALVDYGAGNLTSVRKALTTLGAEFFTPASPAVRATLRRSSCPASATSPPRAALEGPWREAIAAAVAKGTPLLGICVGMQWLFEGSDEAPGVPGLGALPGRIAAARRQRRPSG